MGAGFATFNSYVEQFLGANEPAAAPELGFLDGLGAFLSEDKGSAPFFLLQADYSRTVNIAVAGNSGVGKSLLVNTVRGVKPGDATWAPVGVTETTKQPKWYEFPGETSVRLWDMEGAGGTVTWADYTGSVGLRYFDVVLVLCSSRLTDSDVNIMQELENQSIPYFFVRTKLDEDVKNNLADYDMSEQETEEFIRCDLQLKGITSPYLINARCADRHDFPRLIRDVLIRLEIFERRVKKSDVKPPGPELEAAAVRQKASAEPVKAEVSEVEAVKPEAPKAEAPATPPVSNVKALAPPLSKVQRPPLIWSLPKGKSIAPIEVLASDGGHWVWVEDDGISEALQAAMGALSAYAAMKLLGHPEHTWTIRPDGVWECKYKNYWTSLASTLTGVDSRTMECKPLPEEPEESWDFTAFSGHRLYGKTYDYIESGRLVSEQRGKVVGAADDDKAETLLIRVHRLVVDDTYWFVIESVTHGIYGVRRFRRYPFYRIVNETGKTVTMKTYSVTAIFSTPNATVSVDPGTSCIDCYSAHVTVEQVVFSLPNRTQYTISQAEPFETYCLRIELFS